MVQMTYTATRQIGFPGQRKGFHHQAKSCRNDTGSSPQIDDVLISGYTAVAQSQVFTLPADPTDSVAYPVVINGVTINTAALDASSTTAELQAALVTAINASGVASVVTAANSGADVIVTADVAGVPFTVGLGTQPAAPITLGAAVANVGTGTVYTFTVNGYSVSYTRQAGDTAANVRDGLIQAFNNVAALEGVAYASASGNNIRITSAVPGTAITVADSDPNITSPSSVQANASTIVIPYGKAVVKRTGAGTNEQSAMLPTGASQIFLGVCEHELSEQPATGVTAGVQPGKLFSAGHEGEWLLEPEVAVSYGDPVYFRHTANGALTPGGWRNDADTANATLVAGAQWRGTSAAGVLTPVMFNNP